MAYRTSLRIRVGSIRVGRTMNDASVPPKAISELADRLEWIREELFAIQRALEKMEPVEAAVRSAEIPNKAR